MKNTLRIFVLLLAFCLGNNSNASAPVGLTLKPGLFRSGLEGVCSLLVSQNSDDSALVFSLTKHGTTLGEYATCAGTLFRFERASDNRYDGQMEIDDKSLAKASIEILKNTSLQLNVTLKDGKVQQVIFVQW